MYVWHNGAGKFMINAHYILSVELHIITNLRLLVYGKSDEQTKWR